MSSRRTRAGRRRALGQNFLVDPRAIEAVVGALDPRPGALVVDLGAGAGALTAAVAERGARVLAVERDPHWARVLRSRAAGWGVVDVVEGDALALPFPSERHHVLSAVPYGIGTQLVRHVLTAAHGLVDAVLVLQLETARRLAGRPATGRFAATWAPWFALRVGRRIGPRAFDPPPGVESAILTVTPRATPLLSPAVFGAYDAFLGAVFAGRGRTVADRLAARHGRGRARAALSATGVPADATPSRVAPEDYARLFAAWTSRSSPRRGAGRPPMARAARGVRLGP